MDEDRSKAIARLKHLTDDTDRIHLLDKDVSKLVASWRHAHIGYQKEKMNQKPESDKEIWKWLWEGVVVDFQHLATITGLKHKAASAFSVAKGNKLIFPDGSVSEETTARITEAAFFWRKQ